MKQKTLRRQKRDAVTTVGRWLGLHKVAAVAAVVIFVLLLAEIAVFALWPQPESVTAYFRLFSRNWFVALLDLDLLGMIAYLLFIPYILSLYLHTRHANEALAVIGTATFFVGIAAFFATNTGFSLFSLSHQYASATTDTEKTVLLAAGQALLTTFSVGAFQVSYVIVSTGWLLISCAMLQDRDFGQFGALSGVIAGSTGIVAVALEHILTIGSAFILIVLLYFAAIAFLAIWVLSTGISLHRLNERSEV